MRSLPIVLSLVVAIAPHVAAQTPSAESNPVTPCPAGTQCVNDPVDQELWLATGPVSCVCDAAGRALRTEMGDFDPPMFFYDFRYDGEGHLLAEELSVPSRPETYLETYTYNVSGQRTGADFDGGKDGVVNRRQTFEYDRAGRLEFVREDGSAFAEGSVDGVIDTITHYTYDEAGNQIGEEHSGADGQVTWRISYSHNDRGDVLVEEHSAPDGTLMYRFSWSYDDAGNRLTQTTRRVTDRREEQCVYDPPCPSPSVACEMSCETIALEPEKPGQ